MSRQEQFHNSLKSDYFKWQKFLDGWLGRKFIREIVFAYDGTVIRKVSTGTNQLIKQLMFFADPNQNAKMGREKPNIWITKYKFGALRDADTYYQASPRADYSTAKIDGLLFDFDAEIAEDIPTIAELRIPYEEAMTLQTNHDAKVMLSARKGFHAHVPITDQKDIPLRTRQERIAEFWGLTTADSQVFGDYARVCRLPYSIHPKSGLQAVMVRKDESLESVIDRASHGFQIPGAD